jgi:hypothetical protein
MVVLYEEPVLRRKFGGQYMEYASHVSRWVPLGSAAESLAWSIAAVMNP